jgi:hypothetical protein
MHKPNLESCAPQARNDGFAQTMEVVDKKAP